MKSDRYISDRRSLAYGQNSLRETTGKELVSFGAKTIFVLVTALNAINGVNCNKIQRRKSSILRLVVIFNIVLVVGVLAAVTMVNALVDTSGMDVVFSDSFDNPDNWANPQGTWQIGSSPDGWGTGNVAYTGSNHVIYKNRVQNLITDLNDPINLTDYKTVILQFDATAISTKRGNQIENVIVTDERGVQHVVWVKSKATFSDIQQVDISGYVAGNKSINTTFQYVKKGPAKDSLWEVDDVMVFGDKTGAKPYSTIQFNSTSYTVKEGNGVYAILNLTCTPSSTGTVTVNWTANDGTAIAGVNYGKVGDYYDFDVNGTVTFIAGQDHAAIQVPILDDNAFTTPDLTFNVSIEDVTHASGNTITGSPAVAQVTINDADSMLSPAVSITPASSEINEGSAWSGSGSFTDPGAGTSWTATVNYGDGSSVQTLALNPDKTFALGHTYADDGIYTVAVTVLNNNEISGSAYTTVMVDNVDPTLAISGDVSVDAGATYTLSLSSSDPGADTISSWSINWGDGNVETVAGNPASTAHVYAAGPNDYVISATAMDEDGTYDAGNTVDVHVNTAIVAYTIPLVQGWNLISIPVSGPTLMESDLLNDASLNIIMVATFDTSSQAYSTYSGSPLDTDLPVTIDRGYFVYCTSPSTLYVTGTVPTAHDIDIVQGWNLIGWSSTSVVTASDVMDRLDPNGLMVAGFDTGSQNFVTYTGSSLDVNFDVKMKEGYFVYSDSSTRLYIGSNIV